MKCTKMICLALIFGVVLNACSSSPITFSDNYVFGQDSQYNFSAGFYNNGGVTQTKDGYYFMSGPDILFLYYYDKAKNQALPVCNKPDCLHGDEPDSYKIAECNAFLGLTVNYLQYYNGSLYYVPHIGERSGFYDALMRISADGTKREELLRFTEDITGLAIHRGAVYYATADGGTIGNKEATTKTKCNLYRFELDKPGAKPELIQSDEGIYANYGDDISCYGNYVYYDFFYYKDATLQERVGSLKRYDIRTKACHTFIDAELASYTWFNGKFVYEVYGKGVYTCDMDGKNNEQLFDRTAFVTSNANFLLMDNVYEPNVSSGEVERTLTVVGKDWSTVKTVSLKGLINQYLGCSDEYYFIQEVWGQGKTNDFGEIITLYAVPLDKKADDMKLKPFYEFVPKVVFNGINRHE